MIDNGSQLPDHCPNHCPLPPPYQVLSAFLLTQTFDATLQKKKKQIEEKGKHDNDLGATALRNVIAGAA